MGVEEEGRSGVCRGQEKERFVLRTKGGAAVLRHVSSKRGTVARTHACIHAHTIPARKDGGEDSGYLLV